jgi:shikimate dehydrogenase
VIKRWYPILKFDQITGSTKILGIIGIPIEHVMSPAMHNAILQKNSLNMAYIPFQVKQKDLETAIKGLCALNVIGFSVTIPHKVAILPFLDEIDPLAKKIGAVNTVKISNGILYGINTDGEGAIEALIQNNIRLTEQTVILFGAGGAARALSFTLAEKVKKITIVNRSASNLETLVNALKRHYSLPIQGILLEDSDGVHKAIKKATLLINTTSVGMTPNEHQSIVPKEMLHPALVVYDIIYTPIHTQLLQSAQALGCRVITGVDMLVNQGALAFKYWTNCSPDKNLMKKTVLKLLNKKIKMQNSCKS